MSKLTCKHCNETFNSIFSQSNHRCSEKIYWTQEELIQEWLSINPNDVQSPTLIIDALAGYVKTDRGYVWNRFYTGPSL